MERHNQMREWLHSGMVPVFPSEKHLTEVDVAAEGGDRFPATVRCFGRLVGVWLGGLVNPGALLSSFSLEVSISSGDITTEVCSLLSVDEVRPSSGNTAVAYIRCLYYYF